MRRDRNHGRVELTAGGAVLLTRARDILSPVDGAPEAARRAANGEFGRLAIGFTGSATHATLPALAGAQREALPGVSLVPDSVRHVTVSGAVYRPLGPRPAEVELAVA